MLNLAAPNGRFSLCFFTFSFLDVSGFQQNQNVFLPLGCYPLLACPMKNRRVVVTQWTARLPLTRLATAAVPSQSSATSLTATRTASLALRA